MKISELNNICSLSERINYCNSIMEDREGRRRELSKWLLNISKQSKFRLSKEKILRLNEIVTIQL